MIPVCFSFREFRIMMRHQSWIEHSKTLLDVMLYLLADDVRPTILLDEMLDIIYLQRHCSLELKRDLFSRNQ